MMTSRVCATLLLVALMALPTMSGATGSPKAGKAGDAQLQVASASREEVKAAVENATLRIKQGTKGRIWCVPFARAVSGIEIRGDAATWWGQTGATYPKGKVPVSGSVLNFRSTSKMPRGHVAVVSAVISPRKILVDHANWVTNRITLDTVVIDVSEKNDWSAVRVANQSNSFGRVYPTYGFIYRPRGDES